MKFLVDAHFPKKMANWLVENGDDAIHTSDLPEKNNTSDIEIINKAETESRIIITKGSDICNELLKNPSGKTTSIYTAIHYCHTIRF